MRTHTDIKELLGVYALDAVDEAERHRVERHLAECEECRNEVDDHRGVAALLATVDYAAPPNLWDRVESTIWSDGTDGSEGGNVVPFRRRPWLATAVTTAAAVAFVAVVGVQAAQIRSLRQDVAASNEAITSLENQIAAGEFDRVVSLIAARPDAQTLTLDGDAGSAIVVLLPDGRGYLVGDSLDPAGSGETYQLWAVQGGEVVSAGLMGAAPHTVPIQVDFDSLEALVLTKEQAAGVVVSDRPAAAAWFSDGV
jgi:hypothetical protein